MSSKPTLHAPRATRPRVALLLSSLFLLPSSFPSLPAQQFQDPISTTELEVIPQLPPLPEKNLPTPVFNLLPGNPASAAPTTDSEDDADAIATTRPSVIAALFRRSNLSRVTLSPDGNYLAYVTKPPAPKIVVVKTTDLTTIVSAKSLPANPATGSPSPLTWLGWIGTPSGSGSAGVPPADEGRPDPRPIQNPQSKIQNPYAPPRLVAAVDVPFRYINGGATGGIFAMNADGTADTILLTPDNVKKVGFLSNSETPASQLRQTTAAAGLLPSARSEIEVLAGDGFDLSAPGNFDPLTQDLDANRGMIQDASPRFGGDSGLGDSFGRAFGNQPRARDQPPRSVSVIGYCADDPQSILIRAQSLLAYGIYKLNAITGKYTKLSEQLPDAISNILPDRQGRVAVEQPRTNDKRFPHPYRYVGPAARKTTLDNLIPLPAAQPSSIQNPQSKIQNSFSVSPENIFSHRSIPLGVDTDTATLYYASNVNRNTYGIYAINLKTGSPVPVAPAPAPLSGSAGVPPADEGRPDPRPIQNPQSKIQNPYALEDPTDTRDLFIPPITGFPAQSPLIWNRHTNKLAGIVIEGTPRTTRWFNPAFQNLQRTLEKRLPGRTVTLQEWNTAETKFLIYADGPADPGAYYIYDSPTRKLTAFDSAYDALNEHTMPIVSEINHTTPDAIRLTGVLTQPAEFQTKTIPVIVLCPPTPWTRRELTYNPETLMLASLGYIVVELNPRLAPGFGIPIQNPVSSEATGSTSKIQNSSTITYIADLLTLLDELSKHFPINPKRISLIGEKYGGYIALRALQLHGDRFSCAVAIDAPVNPAKWLDAIKLTTGESEPLLCAPYYDTPQELKAAPLIKQTRLIQKPIYVLNRYVMPREGRDGTSILQPGEDMFDDAQKLVDQQHAYGVDSLFEPIGGRSRAILLSDAEKFIRSVQTNARVLFGPLRVIETPPAAPATPAKGAKRAKAKTQPQN